MSDSAAPARTTRRSPAETGVWVFVIGDMIVFAVFFAVIVVLAAQEPELVRESQSHLSLASGALNTILLLTSSVLVAFGVRAVREPSSTAGHGRARRLFGLALLCALAFIAVKAYEYGTKLDAGFSPNTNDFFGYFYVFTAIHLMHVTAGIVVLAWLMRLARRPVLGPKDVMLVESGASYWHMVDLLWIVLFPLLYLVN